MVGECRRGLNDRTPEHGHLASTAIRGTELLLARRLPFFSSDYFVLPLTYLWYIFCYTSSVAQPLRLSRARTRVPLRFTLMGDGLARGLLRFEANKAPLHQAVA